MILIQLTHRKDEGEEKVNGFAVDDLKCKKKL